MHTTATRLEARQVPLGGLRGIQVLRLLPHRQVSFIGAWCFLDRFGPTEAIMEVLPHPHTGLQTVTWPLEGLIRHRDSLDNDIVLKPGELNLMTAGDGIAHSEFSLQPNPQDPEARLDALQFWVVLPDPVRTGKSAFNHYDALPFFEVTADVHATVILGRYGGISSPADTHSPLVGMQIQVETSDPFELELEPGWEHGIFVLDAATDIDDGRKNERVEANELMYYPPGTTSLEIAAPAGSRLFLMGGEPLEEDVVMWWNFVAHTHDEIVVARADWQDPQRRAERFGRVITHNDNEVIPAPPLPEVKILPRNRSRNREPEDR